MQNYYVTDSRTLEHAGPMTLAEAQVWLGEACKLHGMELDDWKHPEYWSGCETPPGLYTENEWHELQK